MKTTTWLLAAAAALIAAPAAAGDDTNCDRQCLIDMADGYLAAMVAHDPSKAPLGKSVIMVENLERIKPGEGLWATLTGPPSGFKIPVADPISQEVGVMTVAPGADGKPIEFAVRLKRAGGKIVEAEHLIGNALTPGQLANLQAPRPALLQARFPTNTRIRAGG